MSDLDVEPVDDADAEADGDSDPESAVDAADGADVADGDGVGVDREAVDVDVDPVDPGTPEYVLYGGKGGVGKTTMAAATGLASAADGTPTLVVSTDPAHSLSDAFERSIGPRPERIHGEYPLYGVEIDPDRAVEETTLFGDDDGPLGGLGEMLGGGGGGLGGLGGGTDPDFGADTGDGETGPLLGGNAVPGADEAAAVQQLMLLLDDDRFDRVVVDTAPTGHTLRLLELPEVMDTMVGRLLTMRERIGSIFDSVTGLFGDDADDSEPEPELDDLRAVRERVERLRETLRDPAETDFRVVMVPEEMSVTESERLLERLGEYGVPVGTVVVNKVMEDLADVAGDRFGEEFVSPDPEHCEFCARRWDVQQSALSAAHEIFRDHDIRRVPLFADEVRGERKLRIVAACLS